MKSAGILLLLLCTPLQVVASHQWAGMDLCQVRKDIVPPGLPTEIIPDKNSKGARLLQQYCTQCHNLPGPGRHTDQEWPGVIARMQRLMEVTHRFGTLIEDIEVMSAEDKNTLLAYLQEHALVPWKKEHPAPEAYAENCSTCHRLPDPEQHTPQQWSATLERMDRNARIMGKEIITTESRGMIEAYLGLTGGSAPALQGPDRSTGTAIQNPWLALGPFLFLVGLGLFRWRRAINRDNKSCATH